MQVAEVQPDFRIGYGNAGGVRVSPTDQERGEHTRVGYDPTSDHGHTVSDAGQVASVKLCVAVANYCIARVVGCNAKAAVCEDGVTQHAHGHGWLGWWVRSVVVEGQANDGHLLARRWLDIDQAPDAGRGRYVGPAGCDDPQADGNVEGEISPRLYDDQVAGLRGCYCIGDLRVATRADAQSSLGR
jgi:hypothetical protein